MGAKFKVWFIDGSVNEFVDLVIGRRDDTEEMVKARWVNAALLGASDLAKPRIKDIVMPRIHVRRQRDQ